MSEEENVFVDAAACGDLSGVKVLLAKPETTREQINKIDKDGRSAFHYACLNDDKPLLTTLLADPRVDVALKTPKGDVCIHLSSLYASVEALKILLSDPRTMSLLNEKNQWGETPLHLCAGSGDKSAARAAELLLGAGAKIAIQDDWKRTPVDVAHDNGENSLVQVFKAFLEKQPEELREEIRAISEAHRASKEKPVEVPKEAQRAQAKLIFGGLGGALQGLKKVEIKEKTMFAKSEGGVTGTGTAASSTKRTLSKLVEFPGDVEEITKLLQDSTLDIGGKDSFGLTALHKFASWNKTELIEMILPKLSKEEINATDPSGKTALHWACEMASAAAIERLVKLQELDQEAKDAQGRTPMDILNSGSGPIIARLKAALTGAPAP